MRVSSYSLTAIDRACGASGTYGRRGTSLTAADKRAGWAGSCMIWSGYAPGVGLDGVEPLTFPLLRVLLLPLALRNLGVLARLLLPLVHVHEVLASACQLMRRTS